MSDQIMMIPRLPDDVIGDILSRLPVKSLLRFRCTSKCWRSLIDSSRFIKLHLNRSIETGTNLSVLLIMSKNYCSDQIIGFDSVDRITESGNLVPQPVTYGCDGQVSVWGSCNGLFCLSWWRGYGNEDSNLTEDEVVLWNPATRESRKLPELRRRRPTEESTFGGPSTTYGLGYDSSNDDYKVVSPLFLARSMETGWQFSDEVDVYSFNSNSWHTTRVECPNNYHLRLCHQLISGALHWLVSEQVIVAFDVASERFLEVSHPPPTTADDHSSRVLQSLGGCLSVFFYHADEDVGCRLDIWVMKDYGVKESWTKLMTITARQLGYPGNRTVPSLVPLALSKSGGSGILFQRKFRNLLWYGAETKTIKIIKARVMAHGYTESLVSLNVVGEGDSDINDQQEDGL